MRDKSYSNDVRKQRSKTMIRSLTFPASSSGRSNAVSEMKISRTHSNFTIDYSPISNFMKSLKDNGNITQINPITKSAKSKKCTSLHEQPPDKKFVRKCCQAKNLPEVSRKRTSCSSDVLTKLKDFRLTNRKSHYQTDGQVVPEQKSSHICKKKVIFVTVQQGTHEYRLSSRLLPHPLNLSQSGQSLCSLCLLPSSESSSSKHHLRTLSGTHEIPDPYLYRPKLRPLKHRLIAEAPTLSYIPHFRQRVGKLLKP